MNQENLQAEKGFSFSGLKDSAVTFVHTQWNRLEKEVERQVLAPINNHLKTLEEIDAEFLRQSNFQGLVIAVEKNGSYANLIEHTDGYINIHDPEIINQGFMEENY